MSKPPGCYNAQSLLKQGSVRNRNAQAWQAQHARALRVGQQPLAQQHVLLEAAHQPGDACARREPRHAHQPNDMGGRAWARDKVN